MPKPELGTKRQCQNCGAKFFDLGKSPIVCPKCATVYQVVAIPARAVARAAAKPVAEVEPEVEAAEVELVSLEEVEEGEDKVAVVAADDIEVEDEPADDTFLEEEEEDSDDVSTLIDGDIEPDEER
ncbi:MAG: hypothetical protein NVSMB26_13200 [Beijerinckiaceae bacterium]